MKLRFLGAARTVTGSFFVMECGTTRFAIDCGLFQGSKEIRERNYQDFPVNPRSLDFLILTHAHIDHSGLIPKLVHRGFSGPIYCTYPTADLASIMLPDSGHIQEMEVEQKNRRAMRSGRPLLEPIYTVEQAQRSLERLRPVNYDEMVQAAPNVRFRLRDAGHILGSAFVELWGTEDEVTSKIVFSGDVGNLNLPIIKDPTAIESADFLLLESTYGNRYHERAEQRAQLMRDTIKFTLAKGGNLIIPSFAVERTQDLLFDLCQLRRQGQLPEDVPVYIDSPLAIAATEVFRKNLPYWDDQTRQLVEAGHSPFDLPNLRFARTAEESRRLNEINGRTIIISASGMCDAGRIKHHLKHNLWRPEATILFVGYQAEGTLGRRLLEGEKLVRIHGEEIVVKADIRDIEGYSAHADRNGLMAWLKQFELPPRTIYLVHGEEPALNALADAIRSELHIPVHVPFWMEEVDLRLRKPPIQEMPVFEGDVQQALKAEHMYLQLRLKLNEEFQRSWRQQDYARLIEYLQEAGAALEQKTRGETGQEPR